MEIGYVWISVHGDGTQIECAKVQGSRLRIWTTASGCHKGGSQELLRIHNSETNRLLFLQDSELCHLWKENKGFAYCTDRDAQRSLTNMRFVKWGDCTPHITLHTFLNTSFNAQHSTPTFSSSTTTLQSTPYYTRLVNIRVAELSRSQSAAFAGFLLGLGGDLDSCNLKSLDISTRTTMWQTISAKKWLCGRSTKIAFFQWIPPVQHLPN